MTLVIILNVNSFSEFTILSFLDLNLPILKFIYLIMPKEIIIVLFIVKYSGMTRIQNIHNLKIKH